MGSFVVYIGSNENYVRALFMFSKLFVCVILCCGNVMLFCFPLGLTWSFYCTLSRDFLCLLHTR